MPLSWNKTSIIQQFKDKGKTNELSNYRNMHTKSESRKIFCEIVTHELKITALLYVS